MNSNPDFDDLKLITNDIPCFWLFIDYRIRKSHDQDLICILY